MYAYTLKIRSDCGRGPKRSSGCGIFYICHRYGISNHNDYAAILTLARYGGLRLEECFRIDTNDAKNAIKTGNLLVKGKGGLTRYVPINKNRLTLTVKRLSMACLKGFEPPTLWFVAKYSIQLSYKHISYEH